MLCALVLILDVLKGLDSICFGNARNKESSDAYLLGRLNWWGLGDEGLPWNLHSNLHSDQG